MQGKHISYILIGGITLFSFLLGVTLQKKGDHQALQEALKQNKQLMEQVSKQINAPSLEKHQELLSILKAENKILNMRLELLEERLRFAGHTDLGESKFKTIKRIRSKIKQNAAEKFNKQYDFETVNSIIYGQADAPVTITAFYDFTCPFCAKVHPTLLEVVELYPDDVKIAFKHYPLVPSSYPSAKMLLTANEQGKYIEMMNYMFEHMKEVKDLKNPEAIRSFVAQIEFLDTERFMKDFIERDEEWTSAIRINVDEAKNNEITGTPSIFINGKYARGRDLANFRLQIDEILEDQPKAISKAAGKNDGNPIQ